MLSNSKRMGKFILLVCIFIGRVWVIKKALIQHIFLFDGFSKTFSKPGLANIESFCFLSFEWKTPIINCNILFNKDSISTR